MSRLRCLLLAAALVAPCPAASELPKPVAEALRAAAVPQSSVAVVVQDVGAARPALSLNAGAAMNPASVMKLVTTYAALDLLGPAFAWTTPVYVDGTLRDGVLSGNLYIKGQGDPKLVSERLWLLLRRCRRSIPSARAPARLPPSRERW